MEQQIKDLKQSLGENADKARGILQGALNEKRGMKPEEQTNYDKYMADVAGLRETIKRAEADVEIQRNLRTQREEIRQETGTPEDLQRDAFKAWIRRGAAGMTEEQRRLLDQPKERATEQELRISNVPQSDITGNLGEYTVPQSFYAQVITALKYYAGMLQCGATVINMAEGRPLPIPTSNDTAVQGVELAENTAVTQPTEVSFGQVVLNAIKYTTRLILVPRELLQDSGVDIEAYLVKLLGIRLGRVLNNRFTVGAGTTQPRGFLLDAVSGLTGTTGKTQLPQYNDLTGLKYSVDRAYRGPQSRFMMNDRTWKSLLQLVDSNGRPLILNYITGLVDDAGEQILSTPVVINNDMPDYGTNGSPVVGNTPIAYGDFSNYWIRTVADLVMLRLVERYAEYAQVGFIGFARYDGKLVDAGTNPIKYLTSPTT